MESNTNLILASAREKFEIACKDAQQLSVVNNFGAAFVAASIVKNLREALTDQVMNQVFMPLMNTTIGFRTDRDPSKPTKNGAPVRPYSVDIVKNAIIDAVAIGLMPTGNQFNIISERMYPTKEGYTALLRKIGCKYFISYSTPKLFENTADVDCKISYEYNGEKKSFNYMANVKKDGFSSIDQIKGKAERKAKKVLYEYLTGVDFGDADETSSEPVDDQSVDANVEKEIKENANSETIALEEKPAETAPASEPKVLPKAKVAPKSVAKPMGEVDDMPLFMQ